MIARQNHTIRLLHSYPASCLQSLSGLIDEECPEMMSHKQAIGTTRKRTSHYASIGKKVGGNSHLQFRTTIFQAFNLLMERVGTSFLTIIHATDFMTKRP